MKEEYLIEWLERMNFQDWLNQQMNTKLLIRQNFIAGVARGFGLALGGTFLLALVAFITTFIIKFFTNI
jgi:hypothetical protein